jgi:hypothetical protein
MESPLDYARKHLKEARQTDKDKESIHHLQHAVEGLLTTIDPKGALPDEEDEGEADDAEDSNTDDE